MDKKQEQKRAKFLEHLMTCGSVVASCKAADYCRRTAYMDRKKLEGFRQAWDEAVILGIEGLEDEARRRAHDGVEEGIYYQGEKVDTVRRYSDTLLIFLLKGLNPERYGEKKKGEEIPPQFQIFTGVIRPGDHPSGKTVAEEGDVEVKQVGSPEKEN